ncbi:hypothetical protein [Paenibacillus sp. FSL M7-0831]|uniref:hypothetical protein n=1 Tax=Paenibacillus sp. FSL M7-0831 TaxID=2975314 RepID=UPI0030FBF694
MYSIQEIRQQFQKGRSKLKYVFSGVISLADNSITKLFQPVVAIQIHRGRRHVHQRRTLYDGREGEAFGDEEMLEHILAAKHPKQAKDLGRKVRGF